MTILFFKTQEAHGGFSNFSRHAVHIYDRVWPTAEHAFQAMKFHPHRPDLVTTVHIASTPREAAQRGRNREYPLAAGWDKPVDKTVLTARLPDHTTLEMDDTFRASTSLLARLKDVVMYEVVYAKIAQHPELRDLLLSTASEIIIEASPTDNYWGWGPDQKGENKLGRMLMVIRTTFVAGSTYGKPNCVELPPV